MCVCSYICIRNLTNPVNESVSHQQPVDPSTVWGDIWKSLLWSREWMLYPLLRRVSAAITTKSSPAMATIDLQIRILCFDNLLEKMQSIWQFTLTRRWTHMAKSPRVERRELCSPGNDQVQDYSCFRVNNLFQETKNEPKMICTFRLAAFHTIRDVKFRDDLIKWNFSIDTFISTQYSHYR